jgi:hypothetical protein
MKTDIATPSSPAGAGSSPASCSGFAVVGRHASLGFTAVTNPDLSRGFRFEEMWIFGEPRNDREMALWRAVAPILSWIPEGMVHRIPNAHVELPRKGES